MIKLIRLYFTTNFIICLVVMAICIAAIIFLELIPEGG